MSSVQVGNAGEHYVMAYLLARGIHAGLADRGNPHFDILVRNKSGDFRDGWREFLNGWGLLL